MHIFPSSLTTTQAYEANTKTNFNIENSEYFMNNVIFQ